ncbi:MAG TPA: permease prefix domain 1-containing protein [Candidatus Acidoferrum sp.]|nr:permease prefix domain 1-containing protein [Candidatus Acidoferrum sp.]
MSFLKNIGGGLRSLFRKKRVGQELDEELRDFLDMAAEEKTRQGLSRDQARRAVRLAHGSLEIAKEEVRSSGWESFLEASWQDLRFAVRMLRKSPGFTAVAVLTLALGIGANTAIFSVANTLLLKPLPYSQPDRLVFIWGISAVVLNSEQQKLEWAQSMTHTQTLEQIGVYDTGVVNLAGVGEPKRIAIAEVTPNLFHVLGITPYQGRAFLPGEDGGNTRSLRS